MQDHDVATAQHDVYAPPKAPVADVFAAEASTTRTEFHVVSVRKFWCLFVATFGLYSYYWFYRHWADYRAWHRESMWPVARAIFSIFFMHSLNRSVDERLRKERIPHAWWPAAGATVFVVLSIVSGICGRLAGRVEAMSWLDYLTIVLVFPIGSALAATQRAANAACSDRSGSGNARLTIANWAWIGLGTLWWALIVIGLLAPVEAG